MSNKGIINPMAKTILTLEVNDQLQTKLQTQLPPREVIKLFGNLQMEVICNYIEALASPKSPLEP